VIQVESKTEHAAWQPRLELQPYRISVAVARWVRLCGATVVAAVLVTLAAMPAHATFPGRNGSLVVTGRYSHGPGTNAVTLWRINPRTGAARARLLCNSSGAPDHCERASGPAVSPDGTRAAMLEVGGPLDSKLRLVSLDAGQVEVVDLPDPVPFDDYGVGGGIRWLPTGERLSVELTDRGAPVALGLDGTFGQALLGPGATQVDWAIDGRAAFIRAGDLHVLGRNGRERRVTFRGAAQPSWSPHGRWIAFARKENVLVVPSAGGKARRITRTGGREPVWSPDGRKIAFVRRDSQLVNDTTFYVHDWRTRRTRRLTETLAGEDLSMSLAHWQPLPRRAR
jgi:dipeptidyl aminopeptidase/acylaminoacyl peptidase